MGNEINEKKKDNAIKKYGRRKVMEKKKKIKSEQKSEVKI